MTLTIRGTGDSITLKNYFIAENANTYGVEQIAFADGTVWDFSAVKGLLPVVTTVGNNTMDGACGLRIKTNGATCAVLFEREQCESSNDHLIRKAA